jgi:small-conductance mechanosensitive channel
VSASIETGTDALASAGASVPLGIVLACGAVLATAGIVHVATSALVHRSRRRAGPATPTGGGTAAKRRLAALVVGVLKVGAWAGALWLVTEWVPLLRRWRDFSFIVVDMTFTFPLITIDGRPYSLIELLELPALVGVAWLAIKAASDVAAARVAHASGIDAGSLDPAFRLLRYVASFAVALMLVEGWGFDLSSFSFFASVVGVGLGFGLQHVVNNFVSGVLVGLERQIKPGDFVRIGEWTGTVAHVGARSVEIRTLDRVTILVPNSRFLESEVVNWSHGDATFRLRIPVGVEYGSDVARVRTALLEASRGHSSVLAEPPPRVEFTGFGESALEFELHVWANDPRSQARLMSDLNYRIEASLRRHGIAVPFSQHDVHVHAPEIERVVTAWGRAHLGEAAIGSDDDTAATTSSMAWSDTPPDETRAIEAWRTDDLERLVERMRASSGVEIAPRRYLLTTYPRCFVGSEAVSWLVEREGLTRSEAVRLGRRLIAAGLVRHVLDAHDFADRHLFYRFTADEVGSANGTAVPDAAAPEAAFDGRS